MAIRRVLRRVAAHLMQCNPSTLPACPSPNAILSPQISISLHSLDTDRKRKKGKTS